jgi:hypothetical protein
MTKEEKIWGHGYRLLIYLYKDYISPTANSIALYENLLYVEKQGRAVRTAMLRGELTEEQEEKEERRLESLFKIVTGQDINDTRCFFCWEDGESFLKTEDFLIFDKGILVPEFKED